MHPLCCAVCIVVQLIQREAERGAGGVQFHPLTLDLHEVESKEPSSHDDTPWCCIIIHAECLRNHVQSVLNYGQFRLGSMPSWCRQKQIHRIET